MPPTTAPKLYAGQSPPDAEFYSRTFKADQMSQKDLIRGLCINNPIARQIDSFLDELLRCDSDHLISIKIPEGEEAATGEGSSRSRTSTHAAKYWELDFGKDTQMVFDEPIIRPLVQEFDCFQTQWMLNNKIPWSWQCSALRIWIRNNRAEMKKDDRLQTTDGGFKRRYPEYTSTVPPLVPSKRKANQSAPPVRLVDCALVVLPMRHTSRTRNESGEDGMEREIIENGIAADEGRAEKAFKVTVLLKKGPSMQEVLKGAEDTRYDEKGDVKPGALSFAVVKQKMSSTGADQAGYWGWVRPGTTEIETIDDDADFERAVTDLYTEVGGEARLRLVHVTGK